MNAVDLVEDAGFEAVEAANSRQAVRVLEAVPTAGFTKLLVNGCALPRSAWSIT